MGRRQIPRSFNKLGQNASLRPGFKLDGVPRGPKKEPPIGGNWDSVRAKAVEVPHETPGFSMDWISRYEAPLANAPHKKIRTCIEGRFNVAIVGRFKPWHWGQHPDEAYLADELEALGANVIRYDETDKAAPPRGLDWAIFTAHEFSRIRISQFRRTCPTLLWTLDWLPGMEGRDLVVQAGKLATLFVTSDRWDWSKEDIKNHRYLPGACETPTPEFRPEPTIPCAFLGSMYNDRRSAIAGIVRARGGRVLDRPGEWLYGEALARFVQSVKVVIGDNWRNDVPGYWSTRNYVVPGAGGFLLAHRVPGLEEALIPGLHCGVWESLEELPNVLDQWIANDAGREAIREAGFRHVRLQHTWRARANSLLEIMGWRRA